MSEHILCSALRAPPATKFAPGEFVEPSTLRVRGFSPDLVQQTQKMPHMGAFFVSGGEGGIRTLGTAQHRTLTFQASPFNRSGTSPGPGIRMPRSRSSVTPDGGAIVGEGEDPFNAKAGESGIRFLPIAIGNN